MVDKCPAASSPPEGQYWSVSPSRSPVGGVPVARSGNPFIKILFFFFNFSLLFVSLLHSAMLRSSSWDHLPNKSFESKSLGSPFGRPHIKVIHSSDSKIQLKMHTFQGSSWLSCMIWICVVSCHFHRIAPACTFCTYFRLESIFSLPGISLPLLWWYSAIHLTGLNKKSELIELLTS